MSSSFIIINNFKRIKSFIFLICKSFNIIINAHLIQVCNLIFEYVSFSIKINLVASFSLPSQKSTKNQYISLNSLSIHDFSTLVWDADYYYSFKFSYNLISDKWECSEAVLNLSCAKNLNFGIFPFDKREIVEWKWF